MEACPRMSMLYFKLKTCPESTDFTYTLKRVMHHIFVYLHPYRSKLNINISYFKYIY